MAHLVEGIGKNDDDAYYFLNAGFYFSLAQLSLNPTPNIQIETIY